MNKFSTMFVGLGAIAMMASCSNDEPANNGAPDTPNGDVAYMTVEIKSPEIIGARATTPGDYVESDGEAQEHAVSSVQFLFFGAAGEYEFTVKADDTTFKPADGNGTNAGNGNVEYVGTKNVIILENVTAKDHPNYVITVLNAPSDFEAGATMDETAEKLTAFAKSFPTNSTNGTFVMTTSSFLGAKNGLNGGERHDDTYYYATKLNENDFKTTLQAAQQNTQPVEIYVERLAAKIQLGLGIGTTTRVDGHDVYVIHQTLAGGDDQTTGGDGISDVDLYVEVLGWGLNATTKQSYMSKQLDTTWGDDDLFANWNNSDHWRSFWGMSYIYGNKFDQNEINYQSPAQIVALGDKILEGKNDTFLYCYENTNNTSIFEEVEDGPLTLDSKKVGVHDAKVTHAILRTRVYQMKDGQLVAPELVKFRGVTYTGESFKAMLLNKIKADNGGTLNYWIKVSETDDNIDWRTVKASDFKLIRNEAEGHALGAVKVIFNTTETIYTRDAAGNGTPNNNAETELNAALAAAYDFGTYPATGTDNGDNFYRIPVEHFAATPTQKNAVEAYYGVVRNHWYQLTINSISKLGHFVFEPETDTTPIIPDKPEDPKYFVGASINILSWKLVNQKVDL